MQMAHEMGVGEKYDKLGCNTDLKMTELTSHGFKLEDEGNHEKCLHCEKARHQDHDSSENFNLSYKINPS